MSGFVSISQNMAMTAVNAGMPHANQLRITLRQYSARLRGIGRQIAQANLYPDHGKPEQAGQDIEPERQIDPALGP
jgi:hypothetical protein